MSCIVAFFVTVLANDLGEIFILASLLATILARFFLSSSRVRTCSRVTFRVSTSLPSFSLFSLPIFSLLFPSFFRSLRALLKAICWLGRGN